MDAAGLAVLVIGVVTGALVHRRALVARDARALLASLFVLLPAALLALLALLAPKVFRSWAQEDGAIEWATVLAFVVAAVLYARLSLAKRPWLTRAAFASVALFCAFVAGEEISWGQRLFSIEPPDVFLEHNFQQELNLHNLLTNREVGGIELDTRLFVALLALFYGGLLPLVRERLLRSKRALLFASGAVSPHPVLGLSFLVVAAAELSYPVSLTGEAAELVFGLCFIAAGALLTEGLRARTAPVLVGIALLGGFVLPLAVDRALYGSDEARTQAARAELEQLLFDLREGGALAHAKLAKKKSVHKRVFTATRAGYLRFSENSAFLEGRATPAMGEDPAARRDRRGWFLDPWNNPYWIVWSRKAQRITLYSFGPNRRRDGRYDKRPEAHGDDVTVHLELAREER